MTQRCKERTIVTEKRHIGFKFPGFKLPEKKEVAISKKLTFILFAFLLSVLLFSLGLAAILF